MANHVMTDVLNHGIHWRTTWHQPVGTARRALPFFGGRLRSGARAQGLSFMHYPAVRRNRRLQSRTGKLRLCSLVDRPLDVLNSHVSTDGGDRTHTHLRELDFESSASANSATSVFVRRKLVSSLPGNARVEKARIQQSGTHLSCCG